MDNTLKWVKEFIKDLKAQQRENAKEMKYFAKGACRSSYAEAAHLDSVNDTLDYVITELNVIVSKGNSI